MAIYGFKTKKIKANKYTYVVTRGTPRKTPNLKGRYVDDKIIHAGTSPTRARASGSAKRYLGYYRKKRDLFKKII